MSETAVIRVVQWIVCGAHQHHPPGTTITPTTTIPTTRCSGCRGPTTPWDIQTVAVPARRPPGEGGEEGGEGGEEAGRRLPHRHAEGQEGHPHVNLLLTHPRLQQPESLKVPDRSPVRI